MLIATRIKDKYELGRRVVMPITEDDYNELKNTCCERLHHENHGYIIISTDSGFTEEDIEGWEEKMKEYFNDNKIKID